MQEKSHLHSLNDTRHAERLPFLQKHKQSSPSTPIRLVPQIRIELEPDDDTYFWRSRGTETTL
ncbi:hypothetical protein AB205_0062550 [Aquarana catesbeiana]|uniref:Uncharacterized protein n=1 Tax=Aquarana catesbeiana TaxID=8400 RepID=A0A2G9S4G2_AQUCT|nr:hypothetical protein AB205_0062550 [Aquarana catesbeiana]